MTLVATIVYLLQALVICISQSKALVASQAFPYQHSFEWNDLMTGGEYREVYRRGRSQWPRSLRRGSAAVRLLGLRVRMPPREWMSVYCECCVVSGRGFCFGLTTRPEKSYRVCVCVCVCVCLSVIVKTWKWGGPAPLGAFGPWKTLLEMKA